MLEDWGVIIMGSLEQIPMGSHVPASNTPWITFSKFVCVRPVMETGHLD